MWHEAVKLLNNIPMTFRFGVATQECLPEAGIALAKRNLGRRKLGISLRLTAVEMRGQWSLALACVFISTAPAMHALAPQNTLNGHDLEFQDHTGVGVMYALGPDLLKLSPSAYTVAQELERYKMSVLKVKKTPTNTIRKKTRVWLAYESRLLQFAVRVLV